MAADVAEEPAEEAAVQAADGGGRRHPRWGIVAAGALLLILGVLTALLAYLVLVHGGIWTLGRHWRRD
jgi:hypothetical protein